jgi:hypothetical protein
MGDMTEEFNDLKEWNKQKKIEKNNKYEPLLIKINALKKADGIYELNDWLIYPSKGFCMNKFNTKKRISIEKFLKELK